MTKGGILQRKCACGQRTIMGGECESCRRRRRGAPSIGAGGFASPKADGDLRFSDATERVFDHNFSVVKSHTQEVEEEPTPSSSSALSLMPSPSIIMRKKSQAQDTNAMPGVGVSKSGELYKRSRVVNASGYIITETLIAEGELTMKPEGATVTISDSTIAKEFGSMGISYSPQGGADSISFSSKQPGAFENAPSSKVSFKPPFTMIYATDFNVISFTRNKIKYEGSVRLKLEIEAIPIEPFWQPQPAVDPGDPRIPTRPFLGSPEKSKDVARKGVLLTILSLILSLLLKRPVPL